MNSHNNLCAISCFETRFTLPSTESMSTNTIYNSLGVCMIFFDFFYWFFIHFLFVHSTVIYHSRDTYYKLLQYSTTSRHYIIIKLTYYAIWAQPQKERMITIIIYIYLGHKKKKVCLRHPHALLCELHFALALKNFFIFFIFFLFFIYFFKF